VVILRRASRDELVADLRQLHQQLSSTATEDLAGLAAALLADERHPLWGPPQTAGLAIVAQSVEDLRQKVHKAVTLLSERAEVNDPSGIYHPEAAPVSESEVCFLYPGQGSQSVNMLRDLVVGCSWNHSLFLQANCLLSERVASTAVALYLPAPAFTDAERDQQQAELKDTRIAQPALGLVELFATDLLDPRSAFGRPGWRGTATESTSPCNRAAACRARISWRLSAYRGRTCAEAARACPGAMASVQAGAEAVAAALKDWRSPRNLANLNAPDQTVIAGPVEAIDAAVEQFPRRGLRIRTHPCFRRPFHPPLLDAGCRGRWSSTSPPSCSRSLACLLQQHHGGIARGAAGRHPPVAGPAMLQAGALREQGAADARRRRPSVPRGRARQGADRS